LEERAVVDRLEVLLGRAPTRAAPRAHRSEAELLADVYANPDDDAPRAVYADALLERGDPRGEFIQLQLAAAREPLDDAGRARLEELTASHGDRWLGPMAAFWYGAVYARGFPERVGSELGRKAVASVTDPAWRTIRSLDPGFAGPQWSAKEIRAIVTLLSAPNLGFVRALRRMTVEALPEIPALPLRELELYFFEAARLPQLARALPRFPQLEKLAIPCDGSVPLIEYVHALGAAPLRELTLHAPIEHLGANVFEALEATRSLPRLRLRQNVSLDLERVDGGSGWEGQLEVTMGLSMGRSTFDAVAEWVEAHGHVLRRLTITRAAGFRNHLARLQTALGERLTLRDEPRR
jgi:uncharacterized protein (TIGR02996 family)